MGSSIFRAWAVVRYTTITRANNGRHFHVFIMSEVKAEICCAWALKVSRVRIVNRHWTLRNWGRVLKLAHLMCRNILWNNFPNTECSISHLVQTSWAGRGLPARRAKFLLTGFCRASELCCVPILHFQPGWASCILQLVCYWKTVILYEPRFLSYSCLCTGRYGIQ